MLKSTSQSKFVPTLPEGWREYKAPSGHSYYYNSVTKQSTYTHPSLNVCAPETTVPIKPAEKTLCHTSISNLISYETTRKDQNPNLHSGYQGKDLRGSSISTKIYRKQPTDKPISCQTIPGYENWMLVHTKLGRRFVYDKNKELSFWRIPEKLKNAILALDQSRIQEKAKNLQKTSQISGNKETSTESNQSGTISLEQTTSNQISDDSENEEDETSESETVRDDSGSFHISEKKQSDVKVEFGEEDIAFQLAAISEEYGLEPDEYCSQNNFESGNETIDEKSVVIFEELLDDFKINPYSPWEKLVEEGKLVDDIRYTALPSMKLRKKIWGEWTIKKIAHLRKVRENEDRKNPRVSYLAFLQEHATPKLYWPEFKRKYRKNSEMRDIGMTDKECEKIYRELISRLKLPQAKLKSDLLALLKEQPLSCLNNASLQSNLPSEILTDLRYISVDRNTRDSLIGSYISSLPPPPFISDHVGEENNGEIINNKLYLKRRQKALEDREKCVAMEKRRQRKDLDLGKEILREEEERIAMAMKVGYEGINSYLLEKRTDDK